MMNLYTFLGKLNKQYPRYTHRVVMQHGFSPRVIKNICNDIGFTGSYLKRHNYDDIDGYYDGVILEYIEEHEEVKNKLLFHEL